MRKWKSTFWISVKRLLKSVKYHVKACHFKAWNVPNNEEKKNFRVFTTFTYLLYLLIIYLFFVYTFWPIRWSAGEGQEGSLFDCAWHWHQPPIFPWLHWTALYERVLGSFHLHPPWPSRPRRWCGRLRISIPNITTNG